MIKLSSIIYIEYKTEMLETSSHYMKFSFFIEARIQWSNNGQREKWQEARII